MLKKLTEFAKSMSLFEWAFAAALGILATWAVIGGIKMIGSHINESRIGSLETEKQQYLKERDEARARDLILQGKIEAKDEVINSLTSQIAESNQRVVNAHNETQSARMAVNKVRSDPPRFDSSDDAGRILELGSELRGLYPDSPR